MTGMLGGGGAASRFLAEKCSPLDGAVPTPLRSRQLRSEIRELDPGLGAALTQGGELTLERGPLAFQRFESLRLLLQLLLQSSYRTPLLAQPASHRFLSQGPPGQLRSDPVMLAGRSLAVRFRGRLFFSR